MVVTIHYPLLLMWASAMSLALGAAIGNFHVGNAATNNKLLRGRPSSNDVFNLALRARDSSASSLLPPQQRRRERADDLLDQYVEQCSSFLTSEDAVADGIISQDDFVDFMLMQCRAESVCPEEMTLKFEQLDINVQFKFIMGVCSQEDYTERSNCIYDLHDQWLENKLFGFRTNDESDHTQSLIRNMCTDVYVDAVKMGFTATTDPTPSPSTSNIPSSVPSLSPSRSSIPSSAPSNQPFTPVLATFGPTALADEPSSVPMSTATTNLDSELDGSSTAPSQEDLQSPSAMPSVLHVNTKPNHGRFSRDTMIITAALLVIIGAVYSLYNRPPRTVTTKETFADPVHNQWDTAASSNHLACLGIKQPISSSPLSARDHRFVNVYSAKGSPIPQFNPSTAGAVVIGTVSIGSSSFSSDFPGFGAEFLANDESEFPPFRPGRKMFRLNATKNARFRHRYIKRQTLSRGHVRGHGLPPSPRSVHSCSSMPITLSCGKKLHSQNPVDDSNISLCDWKAVSYMSQEIHCESSATGAAAAAGHNAFFFDLFTADSTLTSMSCHSLPAIPRQFSFASSGSDVEVSSILSESFFKADSSYIQRQSIAVSLQSSSLHTGTTHSDGDVLVPWRKEGFSQEMEFSDSNRSDRSDSDSSVSYVANHSNKRGLFGPSKRLFAAFRKKANAKFTFRSKHYQHLRVELHEDPSVLSMSNSYLSETNLTTQQQRQTPANPPQVVLGTFAAAALPCSPEPDLSLVEAESQPAVGISSKDGSTPPSASSCICIAQTGTDLEGNGVIQAEKSDSASAFSHSQFESSKGWSSCSRFSSSSSSSSDSSSAGSQWHSNHLDGSFAEAIAIDGLLSDKAGTDTEIQDKAESSQILSELESSSGAWEVSESSEVPEEEDGHESHIGTLRDLSDSEQNTSLLPHLISYSSEDMSFPSDELSPVIGSTALKSAQLQPKNVQDGDACTVKPAKDSTPDNSAEYVIAWAIENETKKLEGNIPI